MTVIKKTDRHYEVGRTAILIESSFWNDKKIEPIMVAYRLVHMRSGIVTGYADFLQNPAPFIRSRGRLKLNLIAADGFTASSPTYVLTPGHVLEIFIDCNPRIFRQFFKGPAEDVVVR